MRFTRNSIDHGKGSDARRVRQIVALFLLLGACSTASEAPRGTIGFVQGFLGGVAADEPNAALIGRDILSAGGTAADAATATYFALAVTMPSSASLGGGGICLVYDNEKGTTEALDFLARAPTAVAPGTLRPNAVPGNARGFFALHSKYGRLRWAQLLGRAENLARFGIPVSRAIARDLATVEESLMVVPEVRRVFGRKGGKGAVRERDFLIQVDLAGVLSRLRSNGPGDFYQGRLARQLVDAANGSGGSLRIEDLRNFAPRWRHTLKVPFGDLTVHFPPPPPPAGAVAAAMWFMVEEDGRYRSAAGDERHHLLAEVSQRAFADRGRWMTDAEGSALQPGELVSADRLRSLMADYKTDRHRPPPGPLAVPPLENPAATSFVVADREGSVVACTMTMNNLFGNGQIARGTGIFLAAMPGQGGRGFTSLGPMLVVNHIVDQFFFAAAASGGVAAPGAMTGVAARSLIGRQPLSRALAAKRLHHGAVPDLTYYEKGMSEAVLDALVGRGHKVGATQRLGQVNAIWCPGGLPRAPESCAVEVDPRGFGLAVSADQ
jgi:gamma-glutamyltranspeptidase/glutathione hydrolase